MYVFRVLIVCFLGYVVPSSAVTDAGDSVLDLTGFTINKTACGDYSAYKGTNPMTMIYAARQQQAGNVTYQATRCHILIRPNGILSRTYENFSQPQAVFMLLATRHDRP